MPRQAHTFVVRVISDSTFRPTQTILRSVIADSLNAWPRDDLRIVSLAPVPRDRVIRKRKSPTRPTFPLLDMLKEK